MQSVLKNISLHLRTPKLARLRISFALAWFQFVAISCDDLNYNNLNKACDVKYTI